MYTPCVMPGIHRYMNPIVNPLNACFLYGGRISSTKISARITIGGKAHAFINILDFDWILVPNYRYPRSVGDARFSLGTIGQRNARPKTSINNNSL